jgi:hypothetical protein
LVLTRTAVLAIDLEAGLGLVGLKGALGAIAACMMARKGLVLALRALIARRHSLAGGKMTCCAGSAIETIRTRVKETLAALAVAELLFRSVRANLAAKERLLLNGADAGLRARAAALAARRPCRPQMHLAVDGALMFVARLVVLELGAGLATALALHNNGARTRAHALSA